MAEAPRGPGRSVVFFGDRLRQAREAANLTQQALASMIPGRGEDDPKLSKKTIERAEAGSRVLISIALEICAKLNVRPGQLIKDYDVNDTPPQSDFARKIAIGGIVANLRIAGEMMATLARSLEDTGFGAQFDAVYRKLAPERADIVLRAHGLSMAKSTVSLIRSEMARNPLQLRLEQGIVEQLIASRIDPNPVVVFFESRSKAFDNAIDKLLQAVLETAEAPPDGGDRHSLRAAEYRAIQVKAVEGEHGRLSAAGRHALAVLGATEAELASIPIVGPPHTEEERQRLTALNEQRQAQIDALSDDIRKELEEFAELEKLLEIEPSDLPDVVIGKAKTLRDVGRTSDAVRAFHDFGLMFEATLPWAKRYAHLAKAFSQSAKRLGLRGGIYVYEVRPGGPEFEAGLQEGDIIVEVAGRPVPHTKALSAVCDVTQATVVPIVILHFDDVTGDFRQRNASLRVIGLLRGITAI